MVTEDNRETVQYLAKMLADGWAIDRADAMAHMIVYVLRRYEEAPREQMHSV
jgi:hypothetical protein